MKEALAGGGKSILTPALSAIPPAKRLSNGLWHLRLGLQQFRPHLPDPCSHLLLSGDRHGSTFLYLGLGDMFVGVPLIDPESRPDVPADVHVGDIDGQDLKQEALAREETPRCQCPRHPHVVCVHGHKYRTPVPAVNRRGGELLVAACGMDMTRFGTAAGLAAWSGVAPDQNESAGKQRSGKTRKGNQALCTGY